MSEGAPNDVEGTTHDAHGVVLAFSASAYAFLCLLYVYLRGGITEAEESKLFVLSCVVVPLVGVLSSWALARMRRELFDDNPYFFPLLSSSHAIFWAMGVRSLRALTTTDFRPRVRTLVLVWFVGTLAAVAVLYVVRKRRNAFVALLVRAIEPALPFIIVVALLPFATQGPLSALYLSVLCIAGLASVFHEELGRFPRRVGAGLAFDLLVVAAMALIVVDPIMDLDPFHSNFFLGPIAAVRSGRSLLVDVNCQYGVGLIYFLAAFFEVRIGLVSPSIDRLALVLSVLSVAQYAVIYVTLRVITRRGALSALVLALMIFMPRFESVNYPTSYPSTGVLRFGLGYVLVAMFALRGRLPRHRSLFFWLEALVVGIAAIWSFESFIYVLVAFLGSLVYEGAHLDRKGILQLLQDRAAPALLAATWSHLALGVFTRLRSGHWPIWSVYTAYLKLYSSGQFGALPVDTWTPWLLLGSVYVGAVVALGYRRIALRRSDLKSSHAVVFAMSALGIAQFTYFIGRSHVNNLLHIAPPAIFVAGYFFAAAAGRSAHISHAMRRSLLVVGYGASAFMAMHSLPDVLHKLDHTWLMQVVQGHEWERRAPPARVKDALSLIAKYTPHARRFALFSHPDVVVEVSLLSRKTSFWPESYPAQDVIIPAARERILSFASGLAAGDVIFVDSGSAEPIDPKRVHLVSQVESIDVQLFTRLASSFDFEVVEGRPSGMTALRLKRR